MLGVDHGRCDVAASVANDGPAERHKRTRCAAVGSVRYRHDGRPCSTRKRGSQRTGCTQRGDVVIDATLLNVELQVCTYANKILGAQRHPVPKRPTDAKKCIPRNALPPANNLGRALTKADFVAIVKTTFSGVAGVFSVNAGFEQ